MRQILIALLVLISNSVTSQVEELEYIDIFFTNSQNELIRDFNIYEDDIVVESNAGDCSLILINIDRITDIEIYEDSKHKYYIGFRTNHKRGILKKCPKRQVTDEILIGPIISNLDKINNIQNYLIEKIKN